MAEEPNVYDAMIERQHGRRESERMRRGRAILRGEEVPKRQVQIGGLLRTPVYSPEADRIMARAAKRKHDR